MNFKSSSLFCFRIVTICLFLFIGTGTIASENIFRKFDRWLEKGMRSGIDTTYQDVPELMRQVYVGCYSYWQNYQMKMPLFGENVETIIPGISDGDRYTINAYTVQMEAELAIDWKGLTIEVPIPILNKYRYSLGIAKNGSVWGFRIRYKNLRQMNGYCNIGNSVIDQEYNSLRTFMAEGYYVINNRKFSLAAGLYADMVQKRSAGSPLVYLNYFQSNYKIDKLFPADFDRFRSQQVSLGLGYAYNFSLMKGKLVFHASLVPMFTLYSHMSHEANIPNNQYPDEWEDFYKAAEEGSSHFRVNAFARGAVNYSFKRYIITFLLNYRYSGYSNSYRLQINHHDMDAQINFCTRF